MYGLKPFEVMDMTNAEFVNFCIGTKKKNDEDFLSQRVLSAETGFYSAYFHPMNSNQKPLKTIINDIIGVEDILDKEEYRKQQDVICELNKKLGISI